MSLQKETANEGFMTEFDTGTVIDGTYEILSVVGGGSMGRVYRARDIQDDATVALKVLNISRDGTQRQFLREFDFLSKIQHPRIVRSRRWGLFEGNPYFSMDYISGRPLSELVSNEADREVLRSVWLVPFILQIGEGLACIHEHGVVHLDLKPSNIIITDIEGKPYFTILDLGLARFQDPPEQRASQSGSIGGTVEYMAPEHIKGRWMDQRSDLYSLGIIIYEILTGKPPFSGGNATSVMLRHLRDLPRPPRAYTHGTSSRIQNIVMKLLEKEPNDRYNSIQNLLREVTDTHDTTTHSIGGSVPNASPHAPFMHPQFLGRESEIRVLTEITRETAEGVGRMVLISGEAGIGKSQLLEEFQAEARVHGMRILQGRCYEGGERTYGPILETLMDLAEQPGIRNTPVGEEANKVCEAIERADSEHHPDPYPVIENLSRFLSDLSRETPTLVCIEDLQWADDLTLRFLDFMRRDPDQMPLVFGLTCRKDGEDRMPSSIENLVHAGETPRMVHLQLEALGFAETTNLVASILGERSIPEDEARRIYVETGGNPLFVVEMVRCLIDEGVISRNSVGVWWWRESMEWPVPHGIINVIDSRIRRLQSAQRKVLEYISIFRRPFSFDLILRVTDEDETSLFRGLERLIQIGILKKVEGNSTKYRFSHGLIQRTTYMAVPERRRSGLHLEVAKALELRFDGANAKFLNELAHHFSKSSDMEKSVRYLTASGRLALQMHDYSRAVQQFEATLDRGAFSAKAPVNISEGSVAHVDFLCAYAEALSGCDRYDEARNELKKAQRWVSDETPAQNASALRMLGIVFLRSGNLEKAESVLTKALNVYRGLEDPQNELLVLSLLSDVYLGLQWKKEAAKACCSAAERCEELGGRVYKARSLIFLAFSAKFMYQTEKAKTLLESSLNLMDQEGDCVYRHTCLYLLGRIDFHLGNFDRAERIFRELRAIWQRRGSKSPEVDVLLRLSMIALERGNAAVAEANARTAEQILAEGGYRDDLYRACALLSEASVDTGRIDEALAWSERASPGEDCEGNIRAMVWSARARSLSAAGRHDEVESIFDRAIQAQSLPKCLEEVGLFLNAGSYYVKRGRPENGRYYLQIAKTASEEMGMRYYSKKAAGLLAKVADRSTMWPATRELSLTLTAEHLAVLYEISEDLTSMLDLNTLLDRILNRLLQVTKGERAMIALKDQGAFGIRVARTHNLDDVTKKEVSSSIIKWVIERNEPILSDDACSDERFHKQKSIVSYGIRSVLCVPLHHAESGVVGALYTDHRRLEDQFTEKDRLFMSAFANLASVATINARMYCQIKARALFLSEQVKDRSEFEELVGRSQAMQEVFNLLEVAAKSEMTVLIQGETGTGKELAARAIHSRSERKDKPFLSANCAALTHELLQSELFGHKKGAFTGASSDRKGLFLSADGGTVFLDEIGNASAQLQSSLLRVLQDGEIQRVGEAEVRNVDVRVIAATNRDLEADVRSGSFREDLLYRLRVLQVEMPPLRSRVEDIPLLSEYLMKRVSREQKKAVRGYTVGAMAALMDHGWPGNVRELENEIMRAIALVEEGKEITTDLFSQKIGFTQKPEAGKEGYFKARVAALEKRMIVEALDTCDGKISRAAEKLGLSRNGLQKMMTRHGLR